MGCAQPHSVPSPLPAPERTTPHAPGDPSFYNAANTAERRRPWTAVISPA